MTFCCSTLKSIIAKVFLHKSNHDNFELDAVHIPPVRSDETPGSCDDGDGFGSFSNSIPASERLDHIASWPDLKRRLSSRNATSNSSNRAWLLKRVPNRSLFKSYQKTEDIVAALDFSYQHCIFEGPCRSENPVSVLYHTPLDQIAKFGCCPQCISVTGTVKSEFPILAYSPSMEVVIWCADWGNLEADKSHVAAVAKTLQNGGVFVTRGENFK